MLDGQTPDVKVIANGNNDINDKAAVNTNRKSQAREHEGNLVLSITQSTWPTEASVLVQERTQTVDDAKDQRQDQDIGHGEGRLGQMSGDHLADRVSVDKTDVKDKRH